MSAASTVAGGVRPPSLRARIRAFAEAHRSLTIIVGMALIVALAADHRARPAVQRRSSSRTVWLDGFSNAGVFVLLALGLNIVVGLAGLLDLGYAAFFAIGAYTYAYGASPFSGLHLPFLADAPRRRAGRGRRSASCSARRRCACAATTWRS